MRRRAVLIAVAGVAVTLALAAPLLFPLGPYTQTATPRVVVSSAPEHIHTHLTILNRGANVPVPAGIGMEGGPYFDHSLDQYLDPREGQSGKLAPLHTHYEDGSIHVEANVTRTFTLGEFFSIWGQPLGPDKTWSYQADSSHTLSMKVNGRPTTLWGDLILVDGMDVVIALS